MDHNNIIESGGFYFIHNFDSGNLGHVERVPTELIAPSINTKTNVTETPDYEFNLWTRPDCAGTEFENGNRTWFYFGIQASEAGVMVRLNIINLNKQGKMYNQGMAPVTRTLPGKPQWERIRDRPVHSTDDNTFTLSFKYRTAENLKATTFFAFTYPFSFAELQIALNSIDLKMLPLPPAHSPDDIYYYRECLIYSLEGRRVDLLTITSHHGITSEREERLKNLFPENQERPFKFQNKKVIFISARVHPGETPSSFVFNGFLNLLLTRNDSIAMQLRKIYVFKMIPFLNPDGVARGHYRTDTRGVNLNRVYLSPSLVHHPTVYASRSLIRYYHYGCEREDLCEDSKSFTSRSIQNISESAELIESKKKKGSTGSAYTRETKREKTGKGIGANKSSTTIKHPDKREKSGSLSGEASFLAEQVYDMKLQEMPSQTSEVTSKSQSNIEDTSLLTDSVLRTCLGSNVHVSTSEELNMAGNNPLRPLRDTLKNSISLLMESNSSVTGDNSVCGKESRVTNVKMGWCRSCRLAISKLEDTMPGIANMVPGYNASMGHFENPPTSIDEYREHQRLKLDEQERKDAEAAEKTDNIFFCTNCFKRYLINEVDQEEIKLCESASYASVGVPCESTISAPASPTSAANAAYGTGDAQATPPSPPPPRDKPKSPAPGSRKQKPAAKPSGTTVKEPESGLYLYIDLHGHASKKGIFMYGNHFEDLESCVECMLLPRIMSLNNLHFHFSSCNFTERNMYLKDRRDGMSREGSGRVAVLKATGLVRSYTLECNYNTGRLVNVLPPTAREGATVTVGTPPPPPKYTPHIFEEVKQSRAKNLDFFEEINPGQVGRSLGASILDLTGQHPNSRIPCSEHRNLTAVRDWLRAHTRTMRPQLTMSRLRPKTSSPVRAPLYARSKGKVTDERKENTYVGAKSDAAPAAAHSRDLIDMALKLAKRNEAAPAGAGRQRARYLADPEPKPKTLASKRRNVLAIRKPNGSKTQVGSRTRASRRSADEADASSASAGKVGTRSYARTWRPRRTQPASSSSSEGTTWEEVAGGTLAALSTTRRRPAPPPPPDRDGRLKKLRLKTAL